MAQETAAHVEELKAEDVPAAEVDAELRLGVLIERRDAALEGDGERWSGSEAAVFVGRPEPVGAQRSDDVAGEESVSRPELDTSEAPADSSLEVEEPVGEGMSDRSPTAGATEVAPSGTGPGGFAMLSVSTGSSGPSGTFGEPSWPVLSEFQTGLFTGAAETFYPIEVPAPKAGPAPQIGLAYSSAAIDGLNTSVNTQVGPVGVGWSLTVGAITEHMRPCPPVTGPNAAREVCAASTTPAQARHFSVTLNGRSSRLVQLGSTSGNTTTYRLQDDPTWRVQRITRLPAGTTNRDGQGEYWVVTDRDGTQYRFGFDSPSADWRPVYYPSGSGWPALPSGCSSTTRLCDEVYQWNLDRVTDTDGNRIVYSWAQELNYYNGRNNSGWKVEYVRASRPTTVEYTLGNGETHGNARVVFNWDLRCNKTDTNFTCGPQNFFDTPNDLWCHRLHTTCSHLGDQEATFWSQLRLGSIQTQIYQSGTSGNAVSWHTVATHDLISGFPPPPPDAHGDPSERKLALYRIVQRPGDHYQHWGFNYLWPADANASPGLNVSNTAADWGVSPMAATFNNTNTAAEHLRFRDVMIGGNVSTPAHTLHARVSSGAGAQLRVRRGSPTGPVIATINVPATGNAANWVTVGPISLTNVANAPEVTDLYVTTHSHAGTFTRLAWLLLRPQTYTALPGLPSTNFNPPNGDFVWLNNRLNHPPGVSAMAMPRIRSVRNPAGGRVNFTYGQTAVCSSSDPAPSGWNNHFRDCFPGYDPFTGNGGWVAWNKWKVTQERRFDDFDGNPATNDSANDDLILNYSWGPPSWGFDDNPIPTCASKSWNSFRGHRNVTVTEVGPFNTTLKRTTHRFFQGMHQDPTNCSGGSKSVTVNMHGGANQWPAPNGATMWDCYQFRGRTFETRALPPTGSTERFRSVVMPQRVSTAGSGLAGAWRVSTQRTWGFELEAGNYLETRDRFEYDTHGNMTAHVMLGDPAIGSDDRRDDWLYFNNTSAWIIGAPRQVQRWGSATSGTGDPLRWERWHYDGGGYSNAPTAGNATQHRVATTPTGGWSTTTMTYDGRGRVATTTTPRGVATASNPPVGVTTYAYNATHGGLRQITDPVGLVSRSWVDNMARVFRQQAPNSGNTYAAHDRYSRPVRVWSPSQAGGYPSGTPTQRFTYFDGSFPLRVRSEQLVSGSSFAASWSYLDGFGRLSRPTPRPRIRRSAGSSSSPSSMLRAIRSVCRRRRGSATATQGRRC